MAAPAPAEKAPKDIYEQSQKEKKYDRQMRMWGAHGQKALETSEICCLGSGATASETLKNLVLPCVGHFVIVDDAKVTQEDLGNNFFLDEEALGKSRAATVTEFLLEMNPEVKGTAVNRNPVDLIEKEIAYFNKFRLVIATHVPEPALQKLAKHLYPLNIPLVILRSEGMLGYARLQVQEHLVWESHPDDDRFDLYLHPEQLGSFPELKEYVTSIGDLSKLSKKAHAELPYVVILIVEMEKWLKEHKNQAPQNSDEQDAFKKQIIAGAFDFEDEENYEEAVENAYRVYRKAELKDEVKEVFEDEHAQNITKDSLPFWVLVHAINLFVKNEGKGTLPCSPQIPDMTSDTNSYVKLQQLYADRSARDRAAVTAHVRETLKKSGNKAVITDEEIAQFCRNFRTIAMVRGRPLAEEYDAKSFKADDFNEALDEEEYREIPEDDENAKLPNPKNHYWYLGLRAAERFRNIHKRDAGSNPEGVEKDWGELKKIHSALAKEIGLRVNEEDANKCLQEVVRGAGKEVHNIAALMGGVGAQMGLKLLLNQYVPLNNTYVFNGIHGSATTLNL